MSRGLHIFRSFIVVSLLLICASSTAIWAADKAPRDDSKVEIIPRAKRGEAAPLDLPRSDIRVQSTLVLIPVTVTDPLNRFVTGLDRENFRVFEDKSEQKVTHFASEDAPLSVGLVFDTSGSMGSKLDKSRQAVAQFFKTANPEDEFLLVEFNSSPRLVVPLTGDTSEIAASTRPIRSAVPALGSQRSCCLCSEATIQGIQRTAAGRSVLHKRTGRRVP